MRLLRLVRAAALGLLCCTFTPQPERPPCAAPVALTDGWAVAAPSPALCSVLERAATEPQLHGLLIAQGATLVGEVYRSGADRSLYTLFARDTEFGPGVRHDVRSISKSVVSLLVGQALADGRLGSVDQPVLERYPELQRLGSKEHDAITLAHLLTMSSGLTWSESLSVPNDETRLYVTGSQAAFVLSRPARAPPGTSWEYHSGGNAVLADLLVRASGASLTELARAQLFAPLGITDWEWVADPRGRPLSFTGLRLLPRDLLKLGRLMLQRGRWGAQQVVPEAWVDASLLPRISTGLTLGPQGSEPVRYGYQWWLGTVAWRGKQVRWSAGFGNGGQRLFVVPELELVVAITAGAYGEAAIGRTTYALFEAIVAAMPERE